MLSAGEGGIHGHACRWIITYGELEAGSVCCEASTGGCGVTLGWEHVVQWSIEARTPLWLGPGYPESEVHILGPDGIVGA